MLLHWQLAIVFSTPAVLEYQASLPSTRVGNMANDQRQKFSEVTQEKALLMHDALEAKERYLFRVTKDILLLFSAVVDRRLE